MRATAIEFRLRTAINATIIVLGFWSPWIGIWGVGRRISLLEWLALELSRTGGIAFTAATAVTIVVAALLAAAAAIFRLWGTAYLGPGVVQSAQMKAGAVMADGPYRHVRNPLYLGVWFMVAAMSFIMPPTGALFTMALLTVFLLRLILGEEAFLSAQLGEPYRAYLQAVPRLFPRLRTNLPPAGGTPQWAKSVIAELNPIGVFLIVAILSWSYDTQLMLRAILISFGISLVARAVVSGIKSESNPAQ